MDPMLLLQIGAAVIAWASATYGIWTKTDVNLTVAWTATTITSVGLVVAVVSTVIKSNNDDGARARAVEQAAILQANLTELRTKSRRLEDNLRLALTNVPLRDLQVLWSFEGVPESISDLFALRDAYVHGEMMRDDEISRLSDDLIHQLKASWEMESLVEPLLAVLASGTTDARSLFGGEVEEAIAAFGPLANKMITDPDEVWFDVHYSGPYYDLLLPLNAERTSVLALGNTEDDVVETDESAVDGLQSMIDQMTAYRFSASVAREKDRLVLTWRYGIESLNRAISRQRDVSAALPDSFDLIMRERVDDRDRLSTKEMRQKYYIESLETGRHDRILETSRAADDWLTSSKMIITANGIRESAITYRVASLGRYERRVELSKYDDLEKLYEYTLYRARREIAE